MKFHLLTIAVLSATLAACGGGGGSSKKPQAPTDPGTPGEPTVSFPFSLEVKGISGINYQIGERSGIVEAGTPIGYNEGEKITFSLGKMPLSNVKAQEEITLKDFFPSLPETPREFRAELREAFNFRQPLQTSPKLEQSYNFTKIAELHQLSNIMQLLIAMDHDGDPENGLDLKTGDWASKLADFDQKSLPFELDLYSFSSHSKVKAFSQQNSLPIAMDVATPLATLYRLTDTSIPVKPVTGYTTPTLRSPKTVTYAFTEDMQLSKETTTIRNGSSQGPDGPIAVTTGTYISSYEYDNSGNNIKSERTEDNTTDGALERAFMYQYTYNNYGALLTREYKFSQNTKLLEHSLSTYKPLDGKAIIESYQSRSQLDSAANYLQATFSYTDDARLNQDSRERFDAGDNFINTAKLDKYTYKDGNIESEKLNLYGATELIGQYDFSYEYNEEKITRTEIQRNAELNQLNDTMVTTENFDDQGRITTKTLEQISPLTDSVVNRGSMVYEYNSAGSVSSCTASYDTQVDGTPDVRVRIKYDYDRNGFNQQLLEIDSSGNGEFVGQNSERIAIKYGNDGEITEETGANEAVYSYSDSETNNGVAYMIHEFMLIDKAILEDRNCRLTLQRKLEI